MVPSLDDWEKQWKMNPQGIVKPAVVQVDFRVPAEGRQQNEAANPDRECLVTGAAHAG
jgi:hypothetical protein